MCFSVINISHTSKPTICVFVICLKGKSPQAFNFNRSNSSSRFAPDFPLLQDKSPSYGNGGVGSLYGSSSTTHTTTRFPPIGTFTLDTNNVFNSSGDSPSNNIFSNGNNTSGGNTFSSSGGGNESNSANLGTRETGIIEKLLVS